MLQTHVILRFNERWTPKGASLQRFLNKLYEFCVLSTLHINLHKTKITIFGYNIWKFSG